MNIAVDVGCLGVRDKRLKVGVYNAVKYTLIHLSKIDTENQYYLYSFFPIEKSLMKQLGPNMQNVVVRPMKGWMQLWVPIRMVRDRINLFLAMNQAMPYKLPLRVKTIGFIYDIAFEKYPEYYPDSYEQLHSNTMHLAMHANHLVTNATNTKNDVMKRYKAKEHLVSVIPLGVRTIEKGKPTKPMKDSAYFLYVGALKPVKNIPVLIKAFDLFLKKTKKDVELYLVGGDRWIDPEIQKAMEQLSDETVERITLMGFAEDVDLAYLYRNAIAFVSPSFYEGFGLTFAEAMAYGCPVIGSDRGSLPEVVGNAGILHHPDEVEKFAESMVAVYSDEKLRSTLSKKGVSKTSKYVWSNTAKELHGLIEQYD